MSVEFPGLSQAVALKHRETAISQRTLLRLRGLCIQSGESLDEVITRLLDLDGVQPLAVGGALSVPKSRPIKIYDPLDPPDLAHTMVLSAKINGVKLAKGTTWKDVHRATLLARAGLEEVGEDTLMQAQDPNLAWKSAFLIAQQYDISLDVEFAWRLRASAKMRGEIGGLSAYVQKSP